MRYARSRSCVPSAAIRAEPLAQNGHALMDVSGRSAGVVPDIKLQAHGYDV